MKEKAKRTSTSISPKKARSEFIEKIKEISGENLQLCYQCGVCSANCPMVANMDLSPREVIELTRLGCEEDIAGSETVWICASCLACTVGCPRGFDLSKIMEAIRLITLRGNVDHVSPEELSLEERRELPQIAMVSGLRKFSG